MQQFRGKGSLYMVSENLGVDTIQTPPKLKRKLKSEPVSKKNLKARVKKLKKKEKSSTLEEEIAAQRQSIEEYAERNACTVFYNDKWYELKGSNIFGPGNGYCWKASSKIHIRTEPDGDNGKHIVYTESGPACKKVAVPSIYDAQVDTPTVDEDIKAMIIDVKLKRIEKDWFYNQDKKQDKTIISKQRRRILDMKSLQSQTADGNTFAFGGKGYKGGKSGKGYVLGMMDSDNDSDSDSE